MTAPALSPPLERVLSKLEGVKAKGSYHVARCPAHEDHIASLSVGTGRSDGRVVLKCHAGCEVTSIVAKIGLSMSDLFAESRKSPTLPAVKRDQRMVKSYDYTDADGTLLFQTCRFEPKTFRQRKKGPDGEWVWSLGETPPVLYRLPQVLAAASDGKRIFVVEGEKDADALAAFGYPATTSPMGAGKWREKYSEALKGAEVVILPDNDDPGRSHAEQVAASLHNQGCTVKMVELPGLPVKGDVTDWFAVESNSLDTLEELIAKTPRWSADKLEAQHRTRWRLDELWENESIMRPPPPIAPRFAWAGRSTLVAAREKIGKSTLMGYIAAQVSRGGEFLGETCALGDVLLVSLEEYPGDTARRLKKFQADATRIHLVIRFSGDPLMRPQELAEHIDAVDPILVIVDTLAAYSNGLADDDNSSTQMTAVLQPIAKLAHDRHVAIILVHHGRKVDGRSRGSTAITAGTDVVCEVWTPADEDADPTLRHVRTMGRVPVEPRYDLRFDGDTYSLDNSEKTPLDQRILDRIAECPGIGMQNLRDLVSGRHANVEATVGKLIASGMILNEGQGRNKKLYVRAYPPRT